MPYKILLVDDSQTQLETLKLRFSKSGYEIETATNGAEGYQKVFSTAPDLVLSDIIMPNLNGYQFCRLIKNNPLTKKIPIILLTVLDKKIDKFWGTQSGADKFLSKTTSFEELDQIVRGFIEKKPVSEEFKKVLLGHSLSDESVQNQISNVLDELLMQSTFLNEFRDLGEFLGHEELLIEKTFALLSSFVDYNIAGLFFNSLDKNEKNILHLDINKKSVSSFILEKIKRDFFAAMPGVREFTIRNFGHKIVREKVTGDEKIISPNELESVHILPLIFENNLLGGICFFNTENINYEEFKFYKTMISELLLLFKMRFMHSETEYLSVTDGLTGLYNRRHFEFNLEREFLRVKRYPADLSLAILDIDYFKRVNDTFGHQFGDYVLREISDILCESFRKTDMIYRYGGEELVVILPETSIANALIPLQRLNETISEHKFSYNGQVANITVSIGVSTNYHQIQTEEELVATADKALYRAKQEGRNKVVEYIYEQFDQPV